MKKRVVTILTLFLIFTTGYAQKYDNVWLWGFYPQYQDSFDLLLGNGRIDFMPPDTFSLSSKNYRDAFGYTSAFLSNANGELELYSNGMWLRDTTGQKIQNGDSINYGQYWETWENAANAGTGSYSAGNDFFFLPEPDNDSAFYLIHHIVNSTANQLNDSIVYTRVSKQGNVWTAIEKNKKLPDATPPTINNVAACKHGNGRDWWIFYSEYFSNCILKYLLTPDTLMYFGSQCIGDTVKASSCSLFSFNGDYFLRVEYGATNTNLMEFNRCNGELTEVKRITPTTIVDTVAHQVIDYVRSSTFSSDGRYLYTAMGNFIFQYDLSYDSLDASRDTIATVIGTNLADTINGNVIPYGFYGMQTGGDGRIYVSPFYGSWHLSYINEPNKRSDTCDFRMMGLALPKWWYRGMPYYPNYRLGRLIGSACDTVYSDVKPIYKESPWLKVYPNPASDEVKLDYNWVEWEKYQEVRCEILDMRGTAVMQMQIPRYSSWQTVNVKGLAAGVYTVSLVGDGKTVAQAKLSKVE